MAWGKLHTPTRELIEVVRHEGVDGARVLDIGAGVGAVHISLLEAGALAAIDVDASREYLATARSEAERRGLAGRVEYRYGDVVELTDDLQPAEILRSIGDLLLSVPRAASCGGDASRTAARGNHLSTPRARGCAPICAFTTSSKRLAQSCALLHPSARGCRAVDGGRRLYERSRKRDPPVARRAVPTGRTMSGGARGVRADGITAANHAKWVRYGPSIVGIVISPVAARSILRVRPALTGRLYVARDTLRWESGRSGNTGNPSPFQPSSGAIRSIPVLLERMTFT